MAVACQQTLQAAMQERLAQTDTYTLLLPFTVAAKKTMDTTDKALLEQRPVGASTLSLNIVTRR